MNKSDTCINLDTDQVLWQGCPAPRCYTFRHWRKVLVWVLILIVAALWQIYMWHIWSVEKAWGMVLLPTPVLLLACGLSFGRLIRARVEWEHIFYLLSDSGLYVKYAGNSRAVRYPYTALEDVRLELHRDNGAAELGWVHMQFGNRKVTLECLEDAQKAYTIVLQQLAAAEKEKREQKAEQRCENKR